ncbi:DUF5994 family protein [Gordonia phthalatica]|uniref:DUF5994 family protein n=1 Tax=Gordonia phthalatica TaxID=1136941 RepID=UPI000B04B3CE|nr:DUF5994 family protein [Gordonia phthalatica]
MSRTYPLLTLRTLPTALGKVHGLWSPLSHDLIIEIDRIAQQISQEVGTIRRVVYRINDWGIQGPAVVSATGTSIRLEGFWRPKYATNTFIGKRGSIELATLMPPLPPAHQARRTDSHNRPRKLATA